MKLSTIHTALGTVICIETDDNLDLQAQEVFLNACRIADHPDINFIEVDLKKPGPSGVRG